MYVPPEIVHTNAGDRRMNSNQKILTSLVKTAQLSQVDIRSLLDTAMEPQLRCALDTMPFYENMTVPGIDWLCRSIFFIIRFARGKWKSISYM